VDLIGVADGIVERVSSTSAMSIFFFFFLSAAVAIMGLKLRAFAIDEIAPEGAFPALMKAKSPRRPRSRTWLAAVEFAGFFSFGDHGSCRGTYRTQGIPGASGAEEFAQRTCDSVHTCNFSAQDQLLERVGFRRSRWRSSSDWAVGRRRCEIVDAALL